MIALSGKDISGLENCLVDVLDHPIEILCLRSTVILDEDELVNGRRKHIEASADSLSCLFAEVRISCNSSSLESARIGSNIGYNAYILRIGDFILADEILYHIKKRLENDRLIRK